MALTKKDQAAFDALETKIIELRRAIRVAGAFVRTPRVARGVAPPSSVHEYSAGFDYNVHTRNVYPVWSSAVTHGEGAVPKRGEYRSGSQNSIHCYSTRLLALQALRGALERKAANELATIDEEIDAERGAA